MMRSLLLLLFVVLLAHSCTTPLPKRPNVVLIIGDDQGYPYFGFMGADYVHTPNMDELAASGTVFTQGYVPSNHCRPALQSLITGLLPTDYYRKADSVAEMQIKEYNIPTDSVAEFRRNFNFQSMRYFLTLPQVLTPYGYRSYQAGKWWEFHYKNGGFSEGMTKGWTKKDEKKPDWFLKFMGGDGTEIVRSTMDPVYRFINEQEDYPFFLWFAPELPHYPFDAPSKYYDLYKDEDMTESAKRYYANCTWFDDGVGELVDYLKKKEVYDNTLFVYINDNGWEQNPDQEFRNDSLRWHNGGDKGKLSLYDQSFRTPVIFSWKNNIKSGVRKDDLIHSTDIPMTILDILDIAMPDKMYGTSYAKALKGDQTPPRSSIVGHISKHRSEQDMMGVDIEGYWVRTQEWFFRWDKTNDVKMLFDMKIDPNNDYDISSKHPEIVQALSDQVIVWQKERDM